MIQPIKYSNVSFTANTALNIKNPLNAKEETVTAAPSAQQNEQVEVQNDKSSKPSFKSLKIKAMNLLKTFNNVKDTTQGAIRGAAEGAAAFTLISVAGKRAKESEGKILGTLGGLAKSLGATVWSTVKAVPSLLTKAPVENIKNAASLPVKFCKRNLSKNKLTAFLAVAGGLSIAALRTMQGKINANKHNADLDHKLNEGHIKTQK